MSTATRSSLPRHLTQDRRRVALWHLTNANVCNVNDLLLVKKEIARGLIEPLIPMLYARRRDAQAVADEVAKTVRMTFAEFDPVAESVVDRSGRREVEKAMQRLQAFVEGCRYCDIEKIRAGGKATLYPWCKTCRTAKIAMAYSNVQPLYEEVRCPSMTEPEGDCHRTVTIRMSIKF